MVHWCLLKYVNVMFDPWEAGFQENLLIQLF